MCDVLKTQADGDLFQAPKHTSFLAQNTFHVPALLAIYNASLYPRMRYICFYNVYMVLFLFNTVIYVFLLYFLKIMHPCIMIQC